MMMIINRERIAVLFALGALALAASPTGFTARQKPPLKVQNEVPLQSTSLLLTPDAPEMNRRAPERFNVRLETSKGDILIEIHRDWAPNGVDRFCNLVRAGYYDQARFHRVIKGRWAQFGVNGDPKVSNVWRTRT